MSHGRHCVGCGVWVTDGWPIPHDCPRTLIKVHEKALREVLGRSLEARLGIPVVLDPAAGPDRTTAVFVQDGKVFGVIKNIGAPQEGGTA